MADLSGWFEPCRVSGAIVEADGVCRAYSRVPVLYPLSLELEGGEALAVLGPNGSGKTTLLRILAGATRPSAGSVTICGQRRQDDRRATASLVGFAGHDTYLYDDLTGIENLRFFCVLAGLKAGDIEVGQALELVGMTAAAGKRVRAYSAGMKRRLCLARILLLQPALLLLDEPHASLDAEGQSLVDAIVEAALATNRAVGIASHEEARVLGLSRRVLVLDRGREVFAGGVDEWKSTRPIWFQEGRQA